MKRRHRLALWIPLGIILSIIGLIIIAVLIPVPYVENISLSNQRHEVEYQNSLDFSIQCTNDGGLRTKYDVPIYIDGNLIETVNFRILGYDNQTQDISIGPDRLPDFGVHTLTVEETDISFTVLEPASFTLTIDPNEKAFVVGESYQINFSVTNTGESSGTYDYLVTFNGEESPVQSMTVNGGSTKSNMTKISSDTSGTFSLSINDSTLPVTFYDYETYTEGFEIMRSAVRGYSYFDIANNTGSDMVVYVVKGDDLENAIAARYYTDDTERKLRSFPRGEYCLFVQTGEKWIPELLRFGKDEKFYQLGWTVFI